jgi:colicin import membrane protein
MRTGLTISSAVHASALLWAVLTFAANPLEAPPSDSLPVDIISTSEFTQMMQGQKTAKKQDSPKPLVEREGERKVVPEPVQKVTERKEVEATRNEPKPPVPPEEKPEQKAEQKPEPPKPQQKAEAKPEQKPEQKVDPIAEALEKADQKPKKEEPKKPVEAKAEPPKPKPKPQPKFDPSKISALLDKREAQRHAITGQEVNRTASLGVPTGNAATLSQSEIDALRAQIQACWNPPPGALDARELIVQVRLQLNRDGSVSAEPQVLNRGSHPQFQVAAESAKRAIRRCAPYKMPIAKYDIWQDVEVTFDPRDMYRG